MRSVDCAFPADQPLARQGVVAVALAHEVLVDLRIHPGSIQTAGRQSRDDCAHAGAGKAVDGDPGGLQFLQHAQVGTRPRCPTAED